MLHNLVVVALLLVPVAVAARRHRRRGDRPLLIIRYSPRSVAPADALFGTVTVITQASYYIQTVPDTMHSRSPAPWLIGP